MAKKNEMNFNPLFASPLMHLQLDLDTDKLTELAFQIRKDKKGRLNELIWDVVRGGWQSNNIVEEPHEEFKKLKKEITQYLQLYHSEVFRGMKFKENMIQNLANMWVNINEKYHYNDWHIHPGATLSGVYYIKHDGFIENGDIMFKNPVSSYMTFAHWPIELIEMTNEVTSAKINFIPKSNVLFIFPSWLEHKVEMNLKNASRISLSFNSTTIPPLEKKL